jgi:lactate racemase
MEFQFKYAGHDVRFAVDDGNHLFTATVGSLPAIQNEREAIRGAIRNPIGSPPLSTVVRGKTDVVLICDDLTRTTPQRRILPLVLAELNAAGIPDNRITGIIALGTHRQMAHDEIRERFGDEVVGRIHIENHDYRAENCVDLGKTQRGTPIQVNRSVCAAQARICVGTVVPHPLAGWGGGGKMIQPGVSSEATTDHTHFLGGTFERPLELVGNPDNFIRQEMETVAERIGVDFIVNTVQDMAGNFVGLFAGHFIAAHREAVKRAETIFRPRIPARADIVVCNAYPANRDYWQGYKPFVYSHLAVKDNGTIILVLDAPEGVSGGAPMHREVLLTWATREPETILAALEAGEIKDRNSGAICVAQARLLRRAKVICVSAGMADDEIARLGFSPAKTIDEAIERSLSMQGQDAMIGVIPFGGETIVRAIGDA